MQLQYHQRHVHRGIRLACKAGDEEQRHGEQIERGERERDQAQAKNDPHQELRKALPNKP